MSEKKFYLNILAPFTNNVIPCTQTPPHYERGIPTYLNSEKAI